MFLIPTASPSHSGLDASNPELRETLSSSSVCWVHDHANQVKIITQVPNSQKWV